MRLIPCIALVLAGGCFYVDPINQRPGVAIHQEPLDNPDGLIHRGEPSVKLTGEADDPEGYEVTFHWIIRACRDADDESTCDAIPLVDSLLQTVDFPVPRDRKDVSEPIQALLVTLEGRDALGARSKPSQRLTLSVVDALPDITVDHQSAYQSVVGTPIDIFALYGDIDDGADGVTVTWKAFSPSLTEFSLADIAAPPPADPALRQVGKRLVPSVDGNWTIEVTATDRAGLARTVQHTVFVDVDGPPCIEQITPIAPPAGATLPITDPTLFQVPVVSDALDQYPTIVGDPLRGETRFEWSIKPPGGPRELVSAGPANSVAFDPASFTVGDVVEIRVEVFDRHLTQVTCSDGDPTCALVATKPGCLQRQTWTVEVR